MKRHLKIFFVSIFVAANAKAYEVLTHQEMTRVAYQLSRATEAMEQIGIDVQATFPFSRPDPNFPVLDLRSVAALVRDGSAEEDSLLPLPRVLNHFFDPAHNNRGLFVPALPVFPSSPDWALEDSGSRGPFLLQEHSFRDAREAFFAALTRKAKADRDVEFGQTFRALGQIVHHLQDMAQPQHVRNDAHCGPYCGNAYPASFFERWAVDQAVPTQSTRLPFPEAAYPPSTANGKVFATPRSFWTNGAMGVAEFTNRNFVSAGTNFDRLLDPRVPTDRKYFLPAFMPDSNQVEVTTVCAECPPGVSGRLVFYSTVVDDAVTGTSALNLQASTESIFDERLRFRGMTPAFSLNRINHSATLDILGPRAVAYSTGMLNYFFRGDISMVPDPASPGNWVIVNNGPDAMSGTFALYYDYDVPPDSTGNRQKHVEWQRSVAAGGRVGVGPVAFPTNPAPSKVGEFMLVFSGTMGSEGLGNSAVGAVTGRKVDLAPVLIFAALRDDDPDHDGIMEFDLFVPAAMADAIKQNPSALSVKIGDAEVPSSSFGFYTPCTTYLSGQCLANLGLGTYPLQWQSTFTKNNQFVVRSQAGTQQVLASGSRPEDLDLISNATLCSNTVDSTYLDVVGFAKGSTAPVKVSLAGRTLFEFTVSPPAADFSVVLSGTQNVALTQNRCRVAIQ